jgi:hypothetical protein
MTPTGDRHVPICQKPKVVLLLSQWMPLPRSDFLIFSYREPVLPLYRSRIEREGGMWRNPIKRDGTRVLWKNWCPEQSLFLGLSHL